MIVVLLCGLAAGTRAHAQALPAGYGFVASEFGSPSEVASALPLLATYKVGLVLDWPSSEVASMERFDLVRAAHAQGVEVHPWLLLPEQEGYWANATNAEAYDRAARALLDNWRAAGLAPSTLVVDMEMPIDRTRHFLGLLSAGDQDGAIAYLRSKIDRAQYARATALYGALVDHAHGLGFKVEVSMLSQVLDDYADGDDGVRQGFSTPLDAIAWDAVTFQAYRTLNASALAGSAPATSSYFVFDYARRARAKFGTRAGVMVGFTDPGDLAPEVARYTHGDQLREDIDAASWAGLPRSKIGVYNLNGIVTRPPVQQWFAPRSLLSVPPLPDIATLLTRLQAARLDAAL
ncbi:MAG TPA: hypothetical protein VI299_07375 [Polyangiales bacterium]